jgi:hypothetical protein
MSVQDQHLKTVGSGQHQSGQIHPSPRRQTWVQVPQSFFAAARVLILIDSRVILPCRCAETFVPCGHAHVMVHLVVHCYQSCEDSRIMRLTCLDTQRALSAANLRAAAISQSIQPVEQKLTSDSFARCKSKAVQTASVSPVIGPRHGQEKSVLAEQTGLTSLSRELYSPSNLRVMYRSVIPIVSQTTSPVATHYFVYVRTSRRGCNGSVRSESPSPSQTLNTASGA